MGVDECSGRKVDVAGVITVCDVGPRDGLQNESVVLDPPTRAEFVDRLAAAGVPRVETASFVNPKRVPAMAGADEVFAAVQRRPGVEYTGLVLNERGYDRALDAGVDAVRYGLSVTDEFGLRNQNQTTEQGVEVARTLVRRSREDGKVIRVTLSVAFGCPYAGRVDPARVLHVIDQLLLDPPDEISLADTIGVGVPPQVTRLVMGARESGAVVGAHFHNTRNTGFANAVAAVEAGADVIDGSLGGIGGCPFAPNATGNIATEDLVYLLHHMGIETGVDLDALIAISHWLSQKLGKELPSLVSRAGGFPEPIR